MLLRNNILLQRLAQPRQVTLPNGRTFLTRYEHVNRASLYPTNVRIKRTYRRKIGPRRQRKPRKKQQEGSGYIDSQNIIRGIELGKRAANTGIDLGKRAANTEVGRMIVDDMVSLIPKGYKALRNKLFRRKKTTTPFESHQPAQIISSEDYQPVQILSPEDYQPVQILSPEDYQPVQILSPEYY